MSTFTALHLSDLHWSKETARDSDIVVKALLEDVRRMAIRGISPDLVFFTGDLVQAGEDASDFASAYRALLAPVLVATGLPEDRLFIIPGNHDVARKVVRENRYVEKGLREELASVDQVNAFIDQLNSGQPSAAIALDRLKNYDDFYNSIGHAALMTNSSLLRTCSINIAGINIGVALFNTAWRSAGESGSTDRNNLLLGERNVDDAIRDLATCDYKIALHHHPLSWLAEFDEVAVSSRLYAGFDLLCCGHTHFSSPDIRTTPSGTAITSQTGSVYESRQHFNGYQFITIDIDAAQASFHLRTYQNQQRREFDAAVNVIRGGDLSFFLTRRSESDNSAEVERFLRETRPVIRQSASDHINFVEGGDLTLDAKEAFVCPPLATHRLTNSLPDSETEDEKLVLVDKVLRDDSNFLIVGDRESGKTSLAHFMAVLCAEGVSDKARIPVIVDFRSLKVSPYELRRAIQTYYGTTKSGFDVERGLGDGLYLFILDNFSGRNNVRKSGLEELIRKFPGNRWIALSDTRDGGLAQAQEQSDVIEGFVILRIRALPRKSIRELSSRWCEQTGADRNDTYDAVMRELRASNLPQTGYMVTLLLWSVHQNKSSDKLNHAVLLTYVVDYLLGKADFTLAVRGKFDPLAREITLRAISVYLRPQGGLSLKADLIGYIDRFFRDKGLPYDAAVVLDQLVKCGILHDDGGIVSFKFRVFQEYFYAHHLNSDRAALEKVLSEAANGFLNFSRELELLAGLRRTNPDIIACITAALAEKPEVIAEIDDGEYRRISEIESGVAFTAKRLREVQEKKVTPEQIDDLLDTADKRLARPSDSRAPSGSNVTTNNPSKVDVLPDVKPRLTALTYMTAVFLLGKIIQNSDFDSLEVKEEACNLFLVGMKNSFLVYRTFIENLFSSEDGRLPLAQLNEKEREVVRYFLTWIMLNAFVSLSESYMASPALLPVLRQIYRSQVPGPAERLMLLNIFLEYDEAGWPEMWQSFVDDGSNARFSVNVLADRMWLLLHKQPLKDEHRGRMREVAAYVHQSLGAPRTEKSNLYRRIDKLADEAVREG